MPMLTFIEQANRTLCRQQSSIIASPADFDASLDQRRTLILLLFSIGLLALLAFATGALYLLRRAHAAIAHRRYKAPASLNSSSGGTTSSGAAAPPSPLIAYDVFVSYSKKDEELVQTRIAHRLEEADYTLCMLYRDVPTCSPGYHIVQDELIAKMEASHSLVLILTQHFVDNEWQTLQVRTAHQCFAKDRTKKFVVVLVDERMQLDDLDWKLGQLVRASTFIRWSDGLFWNKLYASLPRIVDDSQVTSAGGSSSTHYSDMYAASDPYGSIVPSGIV